MASTSYDNVAALQRSVGKSLLQHVKQVDGCDIVLDLGCGTGDLSSQFLQQETCVPGHIPQQLIALDIALPMLQITRNKLQNSCSVTYLCADAECLPLPPHSVDKVISNLALQWCGDLEKTLRGIKYILKSEGTLLFTTFGASTLQELKSAWAGVDDYDHVNHFYSMEQLAQILQRTGFHPITLETESYLPTYESVWGLMAELKQLGAHTVMARGNKYLTTKTTMQRMINAYPKQDEDGAVVATFEVITAVVST